MENEFSYVDRDLSWLSFNYRVLQEASHETVPLFERLRFLTIYSSNLDEFFSVRVPAISALNDLEESQAEGVSTTDNTLTREVHTEVIRQQQEFGKILKELLPRLSEQGLRIHYGNQFSEALHQETRGYFRTKVAGLLQPIPLYGATDNKAQVNNNALFLIAGVNKIGEEQTEQLLFNIPTDELPRFIPFNIDGKTEWVFLEDIIREHLSLTLPGYIVGECYNIKINRNAEFALVDEDSDMQMQITDMLNKRKQGIPTRCLYHESMPLSLQLTLSHYLHIPFHEMVPGGRYHRLKDLSQLPPPSNSCYIPQPPINHPVLSNSDLLMDKLDKEGDQLLHLPYQTYDPILQWFNEAVWHPEVKAVYVTLYRVASHSGIANALISAAKKGKKVVVFVELKARFDEANNIAWAEKLEQAGAKLIYSIPRIKVHAKLGLIERETKDGIQRYALLSTGNFNEITAKIYTDQIYLTSNAELTDEVAKIFDHLLQQAKPNKLAMYPWQYLLIAQANLITEFSMRIHREAEAARKGLPARIIIKLNNLQNKEMIDLLYAASNAGVQIDLLIRGICCLNPGVKGQSENIRLFRLVDRYLEHSRIFYFQNAGKDELFIGSADWMDRNLLHRIEVCFPIRKEQHKKELMLILESQLNDDTNTIELGPNHGVVERKTKGELNAQKHIYTHFASQQLALQSPLGVHKIKGGI